MGFFFWLLWIMGGGHGITGEPCSFLVGFRMGLASRLMCIFFFLFRTDLFLEYTRETRSIGKGWV
jgi:hypothetical protein